MFSSFLVESLDGIGDDNCKVSTSREGMTAYIREHSTDTDYIHGRMKLIPYFGVKH